MSQAEVRKKERVKWENRMVKYVRVIKNEKKVTIVRHEKINKKNSSKFHAMSICNNYI